MDHKKTSNHHLRLNRRSFLDAAGRLAGGGLAVGAIFETIRPSSAWGQRPAKETHPSSARVVDRFKTRLSFQISVDVGTLDLGLTVASAALAGGVNIVEMGTPLLKTQGVSNVVPAFRKRFPDALLLADMKTMDGGAGEARSVYAGGGNIFDFLALAGADTAKSICAVRDELDARAPNCRDLSFPTSWCRTRAPPRRQARSRFGWSRPASTRLVSTCSPTRGAQTRNSSRTTISVRWLAPSSNGSARRSRCRWSAASASHRQKALPRRACAPS